MSNREICFGPWHIHPSERRLFLGDEPIELNARYFDALLLLVRHPGQLVTKERFMTEVWRGIPVSDEALTQCIRSLRRVLGDEVGNPRFIETVPKHGYRFIAVVEPCGPAQTGGAIPLSRGLAVTAAGLAGGAVAGLAGGLGYGLLAASNPPAGAGAISVVLVLACVCLLIGLLGGLGIAAGVAMAQQLLGRRLPATMLGGAAGGALMGAVVRLVGLDAFTMIIGSRPVAITGGSEGLVIGALAGASIWFALHGTLPGRAIGTGAAFGALAGLLIAVTGGQMMAGSLAVLASAHPDAPLGNLIGDRMLLFWPRLITSVMEGATFVGALSGAFSLVRSQELRRRERPVNRTDP
jgi:DNA-binding winged helix-turn-helix (wHTH) protein